MIGSPIIPDAIFEQARSNKARVFSAHAGDGSSGAERKKGDILATLQHTPKFKLDATAPFFAIGSCFARNIELSLAQQGLHCVTSQCVFPDDYYELRGFGARNGALNAYTPGSIMDLIRFAKRSEAETVALQDVGDGQWADMLMSGLRLLNDDEAASARKQLLQTYRNLPDARTVIITLGYTESWREKATGMFINRPPAGNMRLNRRAGHYEFLNMSAEQILGAVHTSVQEIYQQTEGRAKLILTVSPVPLASTFTGQDVITANDFSKGVLLAAAREVSSAYDFVDYFPSYQYVIHSHPEAAWDNDGVHVKYSLVNRIMQRFCEMYFD
ncbi:GSCFA domain-containing protein [Microvirga aerilata]|uniref:GSCFA domain-containing protein n=1 Tax=Microvirga aerilata TaxID=670292 RepID=A0A937CZ73_9HYPH|nr:GSCFA domain-containing protein [Microvirga aerilata]MBL0406319.1 GSCFA domain-containing protein [Microvirga aerilata]